MKAQTILCFLIALHACGFAQEPLCGLNWLEATESQKGTPTGQVKASFLNRLDSAIGHQNGGLAFRAAVAIPVAVHVVWNAPEENLSDKQVLQQVEVLNQDFNSENEDLQSLPDEFRPLVARSGIRFCLAAETPDGQPASGITRHRTAMVGIGTKEDLYGIAPAWDPERYLNIWVANTGDFLTGFGTYPGIVPPERQGVVVHPKYFGPNSSLRYNLGRVAVHEIGHFLGLEHTWGSDENCGTDDGVADTPLQQHPYTGCPAFPQFSCGNNNMFMNFMDYVDDACMVTFSQGQMERMLATIETFRPGLKESHIGCVQIPESPDVAIFDVFPNPNQGEVTVRTNKAGAWPKPVEIYDLFGQKVFQEELVIFDGMKFWLPEIATGLYLMKIGGSTKKLVMK